MINETKQGDIEIKSDKQYEIISVVRFNWLIKMTRSEPKQYDRYFVLSLPLHVVITHLQCPLIWRAHTICLSGEQDLYGLLYL